MTAKIIDGRVIAQQMREELSGQVEAMRQQGVQPGLGVLLVGDDPASCSYVRAKEKACSKMGIYSRQMRLESTATYDEIASAVCDLNADSKIHGVLVQLPLPDGSMEESILQLVSPEKDVDGFHPVNVGKMMLGMPAPRPCTPHGILHLLNRSGISVEGKHVVIVGRSNLVGRPLANMLTMKDKWGNATVTLCHSRSGDLSVYTRQADILIAAAGRPELIKADMLKEGVVVIDVGVNRVEDPSQGKGYRLCGDVEYEEAVKIASAITPVPGGVGPMTITMLLHNTIQAASRQSGLDLESGAHG